MHTVIDDDGGEGRVRPRERWRWLVVVEDGEDARKVWSSN